MKTKTLNKKTFNKLLKLFGSKEAIAVQLCITSRQLDNYISGKTAVPKLRMEKIEALLNGGWI